MRMNMNKCIIVLVFVLGFLKAEAQTQFLAKGKIEYERKINVHRQFDDLGYDDEWFKEYVSKMPKFHTTYFDLYFDDEQTIYKPGKEVQNPETWGVGPAKENVIVTDLNKKMVTSQKAVFENTYLIQDSIRKIEWKITDEARTIAGFECRKAVGKICDSVYVVAFFTDEITTSGGPESFCGLPGMILEIAIPRLYTTWVATKVELVEPSTNQFTPPAKGKKINERDLEKKLQSSLSDWGKEGNRNIWWVML
jgi:GLPGLI family protein